MRGRRGRPRSRPIKLAGDKGYSDPRIRRWLARHGIKAVIPRRKNQKPDDKRVRFDQVAYKRRSVVEQCVGWPKECRAVATRFDKLAVNDLATVHWAMIQRYLRLLAPPVVPSDRAYLCTDPSASVADILGLVADRFALEITFGEVKQVVGAGQQQVRFLWSNIGAFHVCLWTSTMTEAWAWQKT